MNRDYNTTSTNNVIYFTGIEVEHTAAFGLPTLFVVGIQPVTDIALQLSRCGQETSHIFFGANHSFNPKDALEWQRWESMLQAFLDKGMLCSLDIPIGVVEEFNDSGLNEYDNFIPQIRVPIPYIKQWNYNTMIKIDDKDFKATNPGVWSHSLHNLMSRNAFTSWDKYKSDSILK